MKVIMKSVNIKLWDILGCFHYILNAPHKLELKWIQLLQAPHPFGFNDTIYHEGNVNRLPHCAAFFL